MRLAFLLWVGLHSRFKSAWAARGLKMAEEIGTLVERRTEELERESRNTKAYRHICADGSWYL
jgi:hypothetical protein